MVFTRLWRKINWLLFQNYERSRFKIHNNSCPQRSRNSLIKWNVVKASLREVAMFSLILFIYINIPVWNNTKAIYRYEMLPIFIFNFVSANFVAQIMFLETWHDRNSVFLYQVSVRLSVRNCNDFLSASTFILFLEVI